MREPELTLVRFDSAERADLYRAHLALKYKVFVEEQGRDLPADHAHKTCLPGPNDRKSLYVNVLDRSGVTVGISRLTMISDAFPHRDWLKQHLQNTERFLKPTHIAVLTCLAVANEYRGKRQRLAGLVTPTTVGKAACGETCRAAHELGGKAVLAAARRGLPAVFFEHFGFYVIDGPFRASSGQHELLNFGLSPTDRARFRSKGSLLSEMLSADDSTGAARQCREYLAARHAEVLSVHGNGVLCAD